MDDAEDLLPLLDLAVPGVGTALSFVFGAKQSNDLSDAREEAIRLGGENADDLIALTEKNRALSKYAAEYTAGAIRHIGYANSNAVEQTADRNFALMNLQTSYTNYKMEQETRQMAGDIRARVASTGISVNEGSPLHYLNQQVAEAEFDRKFTVGAERLSALGYLADEKEKARLMRMDADQRADMTVFNEAIASEIAWNEAQARAASMRRGAEMNAATLDIQANAALYSGISQGLGWWA